MSRRAPGTAGSRVRARTNAFELTWSRSNHNNGFVYHYDAIVPSWDTKGREFKLGNKKGTEIIMRLQTSVRPDLFNPLGAFDGKKNLFSFQAYSITSEEFRVPWDVGRSNRQKEVDVRVVFVKKIDVSTLARLMKGDPKSMNPESDAATALTMLNLFVQSTPRMTEPRIYNAKSFFTPHNKRSGDKIRPLELWRGHFQSVRATFDRIIVNVDVTIGVILPRGNLEHICGDFLNVRNLRDIGRTDLGKLRLFLKGVKVEVDLPGHAGKRPKTIKDVLTNVGEIKFEKDGGEMVSIAEHFATAHRYTIRSGSLGVKLGSDGNFPMSVCKTVQQLYKNRSSPDVVREALDFSPSGPSQRLDAISAGWQQLQYTDSPFLIGAGITVKSEPLLVNGRVLPPPMMTFGAKFRLSLQRQGLWDVMHKQLTEPSIVRSWTIVDFAGCGPSDLGPFVSELQRSMKALGITVEEPKGVTRAAPGADVASVLTQAGAQARAQMILAILPDSAPQLYRDVKRFGDIERGVVTQCVKWSRKLAGDVARGKANQYCNNLILKINAKMGGVNFVPTDEAMEYMGQSPTMVIGADVSHPGPGSLLPSIAALVASMDNKMSKYIASIRVQASRTEIIEDLAEMFHIALKRFQTVHKTLLPRRIFMFRDGVSEGEFKIVLDRELEAMKNAITDLYPADRSQWPEVTFIVVGKRHHFRFFPADHQSQDPRGNGNLRAGFVVDQDIVHPVYPDFYLQSQPGLKGTSRPSHYTVLRNDSGLGADQLQRIAYALCHCYSRATRSVKIPAPVYYADLVCRRAKFHFSEAVADVDVMSTPSNEEHHLDFFKEHFAAINERMRDTMYFV